MLSDQSQRPGESHKRDNTAQGGSSNTGATQKMTYRQAIGSWGDVRDDWKGLSSEPNNQLNVCTILITEDEVGGIKLV